MSKLDVQQQLRGFEKFLNGEHFFIVGLPKSGTTWVQHLLNSHEDVICRGESHFFDILFPQIQRSFQHYNKEILNQGGIVAHLKEYGGHVESLNYRIDDTHLVLLYCIYIMFRKWIDSDGNALILGEKTPDSIRHLNLINSLLPRSKIIHVIRDGRDCATSAWFFNLSGMKSNKIVTQSFDNFASRFLKEWKSNITMAQTMGIELGDRYCEVRYEALLEQTNLEVTKLARFLGIRDEHKIVEQCVRNACFEKMGDGHPQGHELKTAFVRKGISGDWKNHFSADLSHRAWSIAGDLLDSLDYPSS
ncbi:MAG: hypothetical protein BMS9Abin25_0260 [Gammaproteobacteria bacterium]|nr:MAG: hypothetical protein BMS9Abin25_0260 [Gammaproteobacteria bacterium]